MASPTLLAFSFLNAVTLVGFDPLIDFIFLTMDFDSSSPSSSGVSSRDTHWKSLSGRSLIMTPTIRLEAPIPIQMRFSLEFKAVVLVAILPKSIMKIYTAIVTKIITMNRQLLKNYENTLNSPSIFLELMMLNTCKKTKMLKQKVKCLNFWVSCHFGSFCGRISFFLSARAAVEHSAFGSFDLILSQMKKSIAVLSN
jgi:hypothetical protein